MNLIFIVDDQPECYMNGLENVKTKQELKR